MAVHHASGKPTKADDPTCGCLGSVFSQAPWVPTPISGPGPRSRDLSNDPPLGTVRGSLRVIAQRPVDTPEPSASPASWAGALHV